MWTDTMNKQYLNKARMMLVRDEDDCKFPYLDTKNKVTIGIGHNLTDRGLSDRVRGLVFQEDLLESYEDAIGTFGVVGFSRFGEARQLAILNMIFNLGLTKFLGFKKTIAAIKLEQWDSAADHAKDSLWYKQVGERGDRVTEMLRTNIFSY